MTANWLRFQGISLQYAIGITAAFFKALSLTMAASLIISFFVAWLAVPLLADRFLSQKDAIKKGGGVMTERVHKTYETIMYRVLAQPLLVLVVVVPLTVAGWLSYKHVGSGFIPVIDEGGFVLDYRAEPGTSVIETDRLLRQVEAILQSTPEVDTYSRRTGLALGGFLTEANEGDFFVRLKPFPRRNIEAIMDDVRTRVEHSVPGLEIELAQLTNTEINISSMMGMTMLVGIVTEVAVFYFSEYNDLPENLDRNTALIMAGKNRMRPIAMTTFAAILALMPLALGIEPGSGIQQPLAIAIISGLFVQLPLVLIVLPIFLVILKLSKS